MGRKNVLNCADFAGTKHRHACEYASGCVKARIELSIGGILYFCGVSFCTGQGSAL